MERLQKYCQKHAVLFILKTVKKLPFLSITPADNIQKSQQVVYDLFSITYMNF